MDVLYRVRPGKSNEQLRYSLRSLDNVEHGEVFIVGGAPAWVKNVTVIPGARASKWHALVADLYAACVQLKGRTLLLVDDDMFVMRPIAQVPTLHAGPLLDHAAEKRGAYARSMQATANWMDVDDPLSYELHVPMVIEADVMAAVLDPVVETGAMVQARSLYGNRARVGGQRIDDVKLRSAGQPIPSPFVSTSPATWPIYGPAIASMLPEHSRYE